MYPLKPLQAQEKEYILTHVWERSVADIANEAKKFHHYFKRYDDISSRPPTFFPDLSHKTIAGLAKTILLESKGQCLKHLADLCRPGSPGQDDLDRGLEFVTNLFFCLGPSVVGPDWKPDQLLKDRLATVFPQSKLDERCRFPRSFNICTIATITDINISWTGYLDSHLDLSPNWGDVRVFHCVTTLGLFRESAAAQKFFPLGLVEETIKSLCLMCPGEDIQVNKWLQKERPACRDKPELDAGLCSLHESRYKLGIAGRRVELFDFWRDRIFLIKEVFDERKPRKFIHFWRDYRRPTEWWAFWIALTAFVLSLVACIEGAMQVYKAYHPTREQVA